MRKIIVGAGEVGFSVADMMSDENYDVVVVEQDDEKLATVSSQLDVMAIKGNGASPYVLEKAGVRDCDLLLAVSNIDEVNLISCMVADRFGVKTKIARVRDPDFHLIGGPITAQQLGIDVMINPEVETADEIVALIRRRLKDIEEVGYGKLKQGDRVRITSGPLRDLEAVFDQPLSAADRVRVLLSVMGRMTPVEIDYSQIVPL